ncbi:MAG: type I-F CRISPR-associated endoribonuclease Cas6/Csy4 [Polaromonas sp.]|nr:type I-F CRISPR-associated endoribonuclease Cas6/Csy4 [Polaromonas sp.]
MDHYIDIRLHTNADMSVKELMATLFYKVHVWLARHAQGRIGLSFPEADKALGTVLRVHGTQNDLLIFAMGDWRRTLLLWISQTPVQPVPSHAQHCSVARVQRKSANNMRQRAMRRHGLTLEQAIQRIPNTAVEPLNLPHVDIPSSSTGQCVRFFIRQQPAKEQALGCFSAYGMGQTGKTVPYFN